MEGHCRVEGRRTTPSEEGGGHLSPPPLPHSREIKEEDVLIINRKAEAGEVGGQCECYVF